MKFFFRTMRSKSNDQSRFLNKSLKLPDNLYPAKLGRFNATCFFLFTLGILFSGAASAQLASADIAIETARQWLTLADNNQIKQMWDQSDALMKEKSEQSMWINYINTMRTRLGGPPSQRVWESMEHKIDYPSLPRGEFIAVTFQSNYAKAPAWERVSLVWLNARWAPVGYQSGLMAAAK